MSNLDSFDARNPHHPKHPELSDVPIEIKALTFFFLGALLLIVGAIGGYFILGT